MCLIWKKCISVVWVLKIIKQNYLAKFYQFKKYLWIHVIITTNVDNLLIPKETQKEV